MSWPANATKHIRLVAFLALVCLAAALVRRIASPARFPPLHPPIANLDPLPQRPLTQRNVQNFADPPAPGVQGRWQAVRTSLGLPPLPHDVFEPTSPVTDRFGKQRAARFDLGKKRRPAEAALHRQRLPTLRFAADTRPAEHSDAPLDMHTKDRPSAQMTLVNVTRGDQ